MNSLNQQLDTDKRSHIGHKMIICLCGPHRKIWEHMGIRAWECTCILKFVSARPLPKVQISHVLRDVKHISQSQE